MKNSINNTHAFTWIVIIGAILATVLVFGNSAIAQSNNTAPTEKVQATAPIKLLLIDVRTSAEFAENGVKPAINIPYEKMSKEIKKYTKGNKDLEIKLYCRSGRRAGIALKTLEQLGYTNVTNLGDVKAAQTYLLNNPIK